MKPFQCELDDESLVRSLEFVAERLLAAYRRTLSSPEMLSPRQSRLLRYKWHLVGSDPVGSILLLARLLHFEIVAALTRIVLGVVEKGGGNGPAMRGI